MDIQAQTVPEEKTLSDIEKAKELFEYEMTDVLLNFKNEVAALRKDPNADYLNMEIKKPEFTFEAPELEVKSAAVDEVKAVAAPSMAELQLEAAAVPGAALTDKKVSVAPFSTELDVSSDVKVPEGITVPDGGYTLSASAPDVVSPSVTSVPDSVSLPAAKVVTEVQSVQVNVPDTSVSADSFSLPAADEVRAPAAPVVIRPAVDMSLFDIPAPVMTMKGVSGYDAKMPKAPSMTDMPELKVETVYPEIPEKPDFSGYIDDILSSLEF